jgi:hypothetical protein
VSPAAHIPFLDEGTPKFFSQRPAPFTNCMFAAVCVPLSFMGYKLPDDFVQQLRKASGVDEHLATSTAATQRALKKLIPDCPIQISAMDETRMLERIAAGEIVVRVMVRVVDLPQELKEHFKPSFKGKHAVSLIEARPVPPDDFEVLWLDPMGKPVDNYKGIRIRFSKFRDAIVRTDGKIQATYGEKNAALPERPDEVSRGRSGPFSGNPLTAPTPPTEPIPLPHGRPDEFAPVPQGTPFLHPSTLDVVTRAIASDDFRLAGRSTDGKFAGVWVNTRSRKIQGAKGMTLLLVDRELIGAPFIVT